MVDSPEAIKELLVKSRPVRWIDHYKFSLKPSLFTVKQLDDKKLRWCSMWQLSPKITISMKIVPEFCELVKS